MKRIKLTTSEELCKKAIGEVKPVPKEKWWQRINGWFLPKNKGFEFKVNIKF